MQREEKQEKKEEKTEERKTRGNLSLIWFPARVGCAKVLDINPCRHQVA